MKFVGLHLFDDNGSRRLQAILDQGVVDLEPAREDFDRAPGWYTMEWEPAPSPVGMNGHAAAPTLMPDAAMLPKGAAARRRPRGREMEERGAAIAQAFLEGQPKK